VAGPPLLEVQVRGSYREIGRAVGEAARPLIAAAIDYYRRHFVAMAGIDFAAAERRTAEYLVYASRHLPQYVEELEGMAEGSRQTVSALMVPNCGEEFTCPVEARPPRLPGRRPTPDDSRPPDRRPAAPACTGVAVLSGGRRIVGHNMDWYAVDVDKNVLFDVTCPGGTRFLTIAGVPYLPILGLSSHGIAYVGNSVYSSDARLGVPNVFVRRWALEAPDLASLRKRVTFAWRARGSNHTAAERSGTLIDIETSATAAAEVRADPAGVSAAATGRPPADAAAIGGSDGQSGVWYAHTNHYTLPGMVRFEGYWADESRARLTRAGRLLAAGVERGDDAFDLVARVLRDHAGAPDAICGHPSEGASRPDQSITVASMICDLDAMRLHACPGPPCSGVYREYAL
jgi:isopenicillin-N N-acyltransferase-like protein